MPRNHGGRRGLNSPSGGGRRSSGGGAFVRIPVVASSFVEEVEVFVACGAGPSSGGRVPRRGPRPSRMEFVGPSKKIGGLVFVPLSDETLTPWIGKTNV